MKALYRLAPLFMAFTASAAVVQNDTVELQAHTLVGTCKESGRSGSNNNPDCQFEEPPSDVTRRVKLEPQQSSESGEKVARGQWDQEQSGFHSGIVVERTGEGDQAVYTISAFTGVKGQEAASRSVMVTVSNLDQLNEIFLPGDAIKVDDKTNRISALVFGRQIGLRARSTTRHSAAPGRAHP